MTKHLTKLFFLFVLSLLMSIPNNVFADGNDVVKVYLYSNDDPYSNVHGKPRMPKRLPVLYLTGHTLKFSVSSCDCHITLISVNDDKIEYEGIVLSGETSHVLPSNLSGTFRIVWGECNDEYYGEIEI